MDGMGQLPSHLNEVKLCNVFLGCGDVSHPMLSVHGNTLLDVPNISGYFVQFSYTNFTGCVISLSFFRHGPV